MSNTVILGAGIVGCSTAFYLSQSSRIDPRTIHLVEPSSELFCCASGLAGGFVAADWFAPSVASLGALSFKLHKKLAQEHDGESKWGYSRSTGVSLSHDSEAVAGSGEDWLRDGTSRAQQAGMTIKSFDDGDGPAWLTRAEGASLDIISRDDSTAQVDPLRLCKFILSQCVARGVQLHHPAKAVSTSTDLKGSLASIRILAKDGTETDIPCSRIVVASGAWSPKVFSTLFPASSTKIPISPLAGHSLLLRCPRWSEKAALSGCHAVFATDTLGFSPELFSRRNGEIYLAGLNSTLIPLPDVASDAVAREQSIKQLKECAAQMLGLPGKGDDIEVVREALCFRPITASGRPIVARVPDAKLGPGMHTRPGAEGGVFIAAGHGAWGISQGPGTGFVIAEMLEGKSPSANITALDLP